MKRFCLILLFFVFILSAPLALALTDKYASHEEYVNAMYAIRDKYSFYVIEGELNSTKTGKAAFKSYMDLKNNRWRTVISYKDTTGKPSANTILYDGNELFSYIEGETTAVSLSFDEVKDTDFDTVFNRLLALLNPAHFLMDWNTIIPDISLTFFKLEGYPKLLNNNDMKNGFECRMLELHKYEKVCVSDKYGIAVYHQLQTPDTASEQESFVVNLKRMGAQNNIVEMFKLPSGMTKTKALDAVNDALKQLEKLSP